MDRVDELLKELNHELIETRNVTIKTDNSLRNLAGDIKTIARRQEAYERRFIINSLASYILFAAIAFFGLLFFFRASIDRVALDHELSNQRHEELERRVVDLEAELERRRQSEREAYDFFELLVSDRPDEVVERWPTVQGRLIDRATIELFRREVDATRNALALEAYNLALTYARHDQHADARDAFLRSAAYVEITHYSPNLHYQLAESLYQLDDYVNAVRYYDLAIEAGQLSRPESIIAYFRRAESLQRSDRDADALEAYRLFVRRFGEHNWANTARQRITRLEARRVDE